MEEKWLNSHGNDFCSHQSRINVLFRSPHRATVMILWLTDNQLFSSELLEALQHRSVSFDKGFIFYQWALVSSLTSRAEFVNLIHVPLLTRHGCFHSYCTFQHTFFYFVERLMPPDWCLSFSLPSLAYYWLFLQSGFIFLIFHVTQSITPIRSLISAIWETNSYSKGQPGIWCPKVRQDLAWMGLHTGWMGHCLVSLSSICLSVYSTFALFQAQHN